MNWWEIPTAELPTRQDIESLREEMHNIWMRTAVLDEPTEIVAEFKKRQRASRSIDPERMRHWGFDVRNPAHRKAWIKRNDKL